MTGRAITDIVSAVAHVEGSVCSRPREALALLEDAVEEGVVSSAQIPLIVQQACRHDDGTLAR